MGCNSSKPEVARPAEGTNSVEVIKTVELLRPIDLKDECCFCKNLFDAINRKPITLGHCGHTICDECKQAFFAQSPAAIECPICKKMSPEEACKQNHTMIERLETTALIIPAEITLKENSKPQLPSSSSNDSSCKIEHKKIWMSANCKCSTDNCRSQSSGFRCNDCRVYKCENCAKYNFEFKTCPNGHSTAWVKEKRGCSKCMKWSPGMNCKQCNYHFCVLCSEQNFESGKCGMGHKLIWNPKELQCVRCNIQQAGFGCLKCEFHRCWKCISFRFDPNLCPNNHPLTSNTKNEVCTNCGKFGQGKQCSKCLFQLCESCVTDLYSPNQCK